MEFHSQDKLTDANGDEYVQQLAIPFFTLLKRNRVFIISPLKAGFKKNCFVKDVVYFSGVHRLPAIKFGHILQMKQKPYNLLLLTGLVFALSSFFVLRQNNSVEIHLPDTYLVIAHTNVFLLLAISALFVWTLYLLTNKILYSKALTWTHVIITIFTLFLFALTLFFGDKFMNLRPRRYYNYSDWSSFNDFTTLKKAIGITIIVLLFGQLIFVINFIVGLFKRMT